MSAPAQPSLQHDVSTIEGALRRSGFPELEAAWRDFSSSRQSLDAITHEHVAEAREQHTAPLFGTPRIGITAAALSATAGTVALTRSTFDLTSDIAPPLRPLAHAGLIVNGTFLLTISAVAAQRYLFSSFHRVMGLDTATMLRAANFRAEMESSPRFQNHHSTRTTLGITSTWDDPTYSRIYRVSSGIVVEGDRTTNQQIVQETLRALVGFKDERTRRHVPGRLTPSLHEGKRSVSAIVQNYAAELAALRRGDLSYDDGRRMLEQIRASHCKTDGEGARFIERQLRRLNPDGPNIDAGEVEARVWERNPWRDLTSQKEFFSSASLRSNHIMEGGSKGRLGTFGYLRNPAICALDLSTRKGRAVRVRLVSGTVLAQGVAVPTLFVDGVEGTNAIAPILVQRAIEDYGRSCNFKFVAYNTLVHNLTPKRFVAHLAKRLSKPHEFFFSASDTTTREYLDAFGLPLQPFEYAYPQGIVRAYLEPLDGSRPPLATNHSWRGTLRALLHQHGLSALYASVIGSASLMVSQHSLWASVGMLVVGCTAGVVQRWYGRRSERAAREPLERGLDQNVEGPRYPT